MFLSKEEEKKDYLQPPQELTRNSPITTLTSPSLSLSYHHGDASTPVSSEDTNRSSMNLYFSNNDCTNVSTYLDPLAKEFISFDELHLVNGPPPTPVNSVTHDHLFVNGAANINYNYVTPPTINGLNASNANGINSNYVNYENGINSNLNGLIDSILSSQVSMLQTQVTQLAYFTKLREQESLAQIQAYRAQAYQDEQAEQMEMQQLQQAQQIQQMQQMQQMQQVQQQQLGQPKQVQQIGPQVWKQQDRQHGGQRGGRQDERRDERRERRQGGRQGGHNGQFEQFVQRKQEKQVKTEEKEEKEEKQEFMTGFKLVLRKMDKSIDRKCLVQLFTHFCDKTNSNSRILDCWSNNKGDAYVIFSDELSALIALDSGINLRIGKKSKSKKSKKSHTKCVMHYEKVEMNVNSLKVKVHQPVTHDRRAPVVTKNEQSRMMNSNIGNRHLAATESQAIGRRKAVAQGHGQGQVRQVSVPVLTPTIRLSPPPVVPSSSIQIQAPKVAIGGMLTQRKIYKPKYRLISRKVNTIANDNAMHMGGIGNELQSSINTNAGLNTIASQVKRSRFDENLNFNGWKGISHWKQLRGISVYGPDSIDLFENEIFDNTKNKNILILGDVDFSLSLSIVEKLAQNNVRNSDNNSNYNNNNNNHQSVIATSHLPSNWRFDNSWCFKRMKNNQSEILGRLSINSIVLHGVNPLEQSLFRQLKCNDKTKDISIDTVIYRVGMGLIQDEEKMKCLFENINGVISKSGNDKNKECEIHFVFPIYNTIIPLNCLDILQCGKCKDLSIEWQLKYGKPFVLFRKTTFQTVFPHFSLISDRGHAIDYRNSSYMAYCIMQQIKQVEQVNQFETMEKNVNQQVTTVIQDEADYHSDQSENDIEDQLLQRKNRSLCFLI